MRVQLQEWCAIFSRRTLILTFIPTTRSGLPWSACVTRMSTFFTSSAAPTSMKIPGSLQSPRSLADMESPQRVKPNDGEADGRGDRAGCHHTGVGGFGPRIGKG